MSWWELIAALLVVSPILLLGVITEHVGEALGITFGVHLLIIVVLDVLQVTHPLWRDPPAPHVELVEIEVPKPPLPPPPPPKVEPPKEEPKPDPAPRPRTVVQPQIQKPVTPPPETPPPTTTGTGGDGPTVAMPDIAPVATGVPVRVDKRTTGRIGKGNGNGPGSGAGSGSGEPTVTVPVSVATIKTRALPKGDYGYFDAGKDYPQEARQLGIEGVIRVRLLVDDQGKVKSAILLNKLGHGLDELALDRARKIEFTAAKDTDDKAVSSVVIWTFNMTLPK